MRDWGCRVVRIAVKQRFHILVKELLRKAIHICTAFVPLFLSFAYWPVIWILLIMVIVYTTAEFMRQRGATVPVISAITAAAARKRDENHFVLGPVTLACGVLLTALFFPPEAAAVGIFALAFGDGLASLAGKLFGVYIACWCLICSCCKWLVYNEKGYRFNIEVQSPPSAIGA